MTTLWANMICPNCGSGINFSVTKSEYGDVVYTCNNCNYSSDPELFQWLKVIK